MPKTSEISGTGNNFNTTQKGGKEKCNGNTGGSTHTLVTMFCS